jgi:hypothetical protein
VSHSTGYSPVELMHGEPRPDLFRKFLKKEVDQLPPNESLMDKSLKAYIRIERKTAKRNKRRASRKNTWEPQVGDLVLHKARQPRRQSKE